jgi:hypothetical protein
MTAFDVFLWWTGAVFWVLWLGVLLSAFGNVAFGKLAKRTAR